MKSEVGPNRSDRLGQSVRVVRERRQHQAGVRRKSSLTPHVQAVD
jgi:hypothetical protein